MRKLMFMAGAMFGLATTTYAQSDATTLAGAKKSTDTINTVAGVDTADMYSPIKDASGKAYFQGNNGVWSTHLVATKISGTTNATAILQVTTNGIDWNNLTNSAADSVAFTNTTGPQSTQKYQGDTKVVRARWRVVAPSSTQATQVKVSWLKD